MENKKSPKQMKNMVFAATAEEEEERSGDHRRRNAQFSLLSAPAEALGFASLFLRPNSYWLELVNTSESSPGMFRRHHNAIFDFSPIQKKYLLCKSSQLFVSIDREVVPASGVLGELQLSIVGN